MFDIEKYIQELIDLLWAAYGERLRYVGLQGSYQRGEATGDSDIDVMVVIEDLSVRDLDEYRAAIRSLGDWEKSCGFICGSAELRNWNPMEICHVLHTTRDCFGTLLALVPAYSREDVKNYVKISLGNLYHEICHRYVHASREKNIAAIGAACKSVFFILQNVHYLDSGVFLGTKRELLEELSGRDREVLDMAISLGKGESFDFDEAFARLFAWCQETMERVDGLL